MLSPAALHRVTPFSRAVCLMPGVAEPPGTGRALPAPAGTLSVWEWVMAATGTSC